MRQRPKQGLPELSASRRRRVHDRILSAASLFVALDYDGTLVPIAARPELARPPERTLAVLASLSETAGIFVAVVSGRNLEVLRAFLPVPNLALAGLHGLEMWPQVDRPASRTDVHVVRADLDRLVAAVRERLSGQKLPRIEDKRHGVTFHYRGESPSAAARMRAAVRAAFADDGVAVRVGKGSRKTHAHYMLRSPAEVVDWLAEIEKLWREKGEGTGS